MDTTRNDFTEGHTTDDQKFKKQYQTVGRPPVTDHNINDEYIRDPPNNLNIPGETSTLRKAPGLKEGAQEVTDPKQDGVLGDEPMSRIQKEVALGDLASENTVHPNSTS
ncbi:uncharacterized protein C8Q71DRAFT_854151 [Rhodofomes roseus]|uniref:Uncharacterized protein n=1 Tax=Rhodofomes roseus TaxID=34475 RepID=A0ABQ8KUU1_9APHY|nr:uncharacterized protein C8Q71DRAFT_854151 [Rhodofomes roseus]KAH9841798.1 hypothetical protein C8Q71DRAFT_854151 [Rhodofomes roseus]